MNSKTGTEAEQLALLMEDASDYRAAREHLTRVMLRNRELRSNRILLELLDRKLAAMNERRARLQERLWSATGIRI